MALEDKLDQVKGAVKENAGKLTDDKQMQTEGAVENTVAKVKDAADSVVVSARIESEIAELSEEESAAFLEDLGLEESGLTKLIKASYALLGLINYFTAGEMEARAWTIVNGTKAPQAAGKIHSDIEKGFIRAEIVSFDDLQACGSQNAAKEKGLVRLEGKEYVMKDGDVTHFRFNV